MNRPEVNDEFLRKRKLRQRKIRRRRIITALVFFGILLIAVGVILSLTVLFPIEQIKVSGSEKYTSDEVIAACGIKTGDNLFTSSADVEELKEKLPYIESVSVSRSLPSTLVIKVKEASEYACFYTGGKYYAVSEKWQVLNAYDQKPDGIFEIKAGNVECVPGKTAVFSEEKSGTLINDIISLAGEYSLKIDGIDITEELSITVGVDGRFSVNFGTSNNLSEKFAHLSGMIKNIDEGKSGKIDLSMWTSSNTQGTFVENKDTE